MANTIKGGFTIDTRDLQRLVKDLEKTTPGIRKSVNVAIREGGELVAVQARMLSSWSSRIPGSIRVGGAGTKVVVKAGGAKAPHAPAFEHHGQPGSFRHPVYGNRQVWVPQKARPFLLPAALKNAPVVRDMAAKGVDLAFREAGFR